MTKLLAPAYCFGAKYALELAIEKEVHAIALNHPSMLEIPKDFERLVATASTTNVLINSCEFDPAFPHESQKVADELLGEGAYKGNYKRRYFKGMKHGFAVRGDMVSTYVIASTSLAVITICRTPLMRKRARRGLSKRSSAFSIVHNNCLVCLVSTKGRHFLELHLSTYACLQ